MVSGSSVSVCPHDDLPCDRGNICFSDVEGKPTMEVCSRFRAGKVPVVDLYLVRKGRSGAQAERSG
jgi:hypothetical protein